MRTAVISVSIKPKAQTANRSAARQETGVNLEFALGTLFGFAFGFLGLLMAGTGFFTDDPREAAVINEGAAKFTMISIPSLIIAIYGLHKIKKRS